MIAVLVVRTRGVEGIEERRFWNLLILGMGLWFAGSLLYSRLLRTIDPPRMMDLAVDICYILLYLMWFLASDQNPQLATAGHP